ncbi:redoxin family protein [Chitinophaga sp. MM2321]|uniref:TlpA family protein disulfide reductase n=1 Tax=Chitinophaga sp. MM2321 TaxID=3137178 RepID=UPI0032D595C4
MGCFTPPPFKSGLEGNKLPSFKLLLIDSITSFDTNVLSDGKAIVLFYFTPSCPYCRAQTSTMLANMDALKDIQFCLLTPAPFPAFKKFYTEYHLEKYNNITAGIDNNNSFGEHFKVTKVPYTAIYTHHKLLKQVIIGQIDAHKIRDLTTN